MGQGSLPIAWWADKQNPVTGLQIVRPQEFAAVVLFHDLVKHGNDLVREHKIIDPDLGGDLEEESVCSLVFDHRNDRIGMPRPTVLQDFFKPISQ
jgi:hypothetical protein